MATGKIHTRSYTQLFFLSLTMLFMVPQGLFAQGTLAKEAQLSDVEISLFSDLASASTQSEGTQMESFLWEFWFNLAPTADARQLLDQGRERREAYDYEASEKLFDQVIEQAPDYFEGYNQRAFVRFLREDFTGALTDLERTLELYPDHFGALSGMYHVLSANGRLEAALKMLQRAVVIHPWIQERFALPKTMWPDSYRTIHEPGQEI